MTHFLNTPVLICLKMTHSPRSAGGPGIQYFDKNVLWIRAPGASVFCEDETLAQGPMLEYDLVRPGG